MKNRFIQFGIFICFLCVSTIVLGQNSNGSKADSESPKTTKGIEQKSEFGYMLYLDSLLRVKHDMKVDTINLNKESESGIKRNRNSRGNSFSNVFSSSGVRLFFQLLAIIFIFFLVYKLLLKNILFSQRRNRYSTEKDEDGDLEPRDVAQYDYLIRKAETNDHFNLAVKYYFLRVLKILDELEVIQFSPDKTNQYYLHEIPAGEQQKKFASLTRIYEYVWYGKFEINRSQYQHFKNEFENFLSKYN